MCELSTRLHNAQHALRHGGDILKYGRRVARLKKAIYMERQEPEKQAERWGSYLRKLQVDAGLDKRLNDDMREVIQAGLENLKEQLRGMGG